MSTNPMDRKEVEAALLGAINAVDTLYGPEHHAGHFPVLGGNDRDVARKLLPLLSATHLGRLIKDHGRELIRDYR